VAPKNKKRVALSQVDPMEHYMKIVTSDTCHACTQQCSRGIAYMEKMSQPGAVGHGVPCILTKGHKVVDQKSYRRR